MKKEDLEKLSKDELIGIILNQQDQLLELSVKLAEFEVRLNMNSTNSSKPPSSDQWKKPQSERKKSGKKPGGQPGHKGHGLNLIVSQTKLLNLDRRSASNAMQTLVTQTALLKILVTRSTLKYVR